MKTIYEGIYGEEIKISEDNHDGNCVIYMLDEAGDESEICIPKKDMAKIAETILKEYKED